MSESVLEHSFVYIPAGIAVAVFLAMLTLWAEDRWRKRDTRRAKVVFAGLLVATIVATASTVLFAALVVDQGDRYEYVYTATVECIGGTGVVYIPVSLNTELQKRIRVESGDGSVEVVETEHGTALMMTFRGSLSVEGRMVKDHPVGDWGPTMLDAIRDDMAWACLEEGDGWNGTASIDLKISNNNFPGHDSSFHMRGTLEIGWSTYLMGLEEE